MTTTRIAGILFSVFVALGSVGCKRYVRKDALEDSIKKTFSKQGVTLKSISCPKRVIKEGDTFECTGEIDTGGKITLVAKQKDKKGSVEYHLLGLLVFENRVEEHLSKEVNAKASLKCPQKVTPLRKGESVTCEVALGDAKGKLSIKANEDEKTVKLQVVRDGQSVPDPETRITPEAPHEDDVSAGEE